MESTQKKQSPFPPTRWSLVARAKSQQTTIQLGALNELLAIYYPVLKRHLVSNMQLQVELAEDLLQSFIHEKIIEKQLLRASTKERGKFRSFLLKCLCNYVRDYFRKSKHNESNIEDFLELLESNQAKWEEQYDLFWVQQVIAEIAKRMKLECTSKQREDLWITFNGRILGPILENSKPMPYEEIVERFKLDSPSQATNLLITSKRMFKRIFDDVIRDTVSDYRDIEEEIKNLKKILENSAGLQAI